MCRKIRCDGEFEKKLQNFLGTKQYMSFGYEFWLAKSKGTLRACLDALKNSKVYKILYHIESFNTCIEH